MTFLAPIDVPVDPTAPVAQQWLIDELSKPVYQAARPTLFDRVAKAIGDWLNSLQLGTVKGPPAFGIGIVVLLVVVGLVVAFLIFGVPRLNRRSGVAGALFGEDDARDAARIRSDAEAAARAGDYSAAVAEMFRAIARGLAERTIVTTSPGTTAQDFAVRAAVSFPAEASELSAAAAAFDDVRYLDHEGTAQQYAAVAALERTLRAARPLLAGVAP
ncbi:MAG: DUF4129 domain-containing protein [Rhodoglobus sp.]